MNREILFRGKREDGLGDWVYGYLIIEPDGTNWIDHYPDGLRRTTKVIPSTVGQFTGLTDKNGVKIWEGNVDQYGGVIAWNLDDASFNSVYSSGEILPIEHPSEWMVVSGNIHDNPELIK